MRIAPAAAAVVWLGGLASLEGAVWAGELPSAQAPQPAAGEAEADRAPAAPASTAPPAAVWGKYVNSMLLKTRTAATYPAHLTVLTYVGTYQRQVNAKDPTQSRDLVSSVLWSEFGVRSWVQLGVAVPILWRDAITASGGTHAASAGLGDLSLYGKVRVLAESEFVPGLTVDSFLKVPSGDQAAGLGNGQTDWTVAVEVSKRLGDFSLHVNPEYVVTGGSGDALGAAADDRFNLNAGLMWHALPGLVPMVEYNGFWWGGVGSQSDVGGGVLWFPVSFVSVKFGVAVPVHKTVAWSAPWTPWLKVAAWF